MRQNINLCTIFTPSSGMYQTRNVSGFPVHCTSVECKHSLARSLSQHSRIRESSPFYIRAIKLVAVSWRRFHVPWHRFRILHRFQKNALHNARDISVCGLSLPTQSTSLISDQSWNAKRPKNATILQVSLIIALTLLQFMQNSHEFAAL